MACSSPLFQNVRSVVGFTKNRRTRLQCVTPSPVAVEFHNLIPSDSCHHQRDVWLSCKLQGASRISHFEHKATNNSLSTECEILQRRGKKQKLNFWQICLPGVCGLSQRAAALLSSLVKLLSFAHYWQHNREICHLCFNSWNLVALKRNLAWQLRSSWMYETPQNGLLFSNGWCKKRKKRKPLKSREKTPTWLQRSLLTINREPNSSVRDRPFAKEKNAWVFLHRANAKVEVSRVGKRLQMWQAAGRVH